MILAAATFHNSGNQNVADITDAHQLLDPLLGSKWASVLFAVALLAAGQNATITGTLAGQIVMEGFLNIQLKQWLRQLITRLIAIIPALFVAVQYGEHGSSELLVFSQVVLSAQLSFAVIPLILFTSKRDWMGRFVNSLDTVEAPGVKKTVLLHTSPNARVISTPALISGAENVNAPEDAKFKKAHIPTAVLLEGNFTSLFNNRLSQAMQDSLTQYNQVFQRQSANNAKVLVAGDGDLVLGVHQALGGGLGIHVVGRVHLDVRVHDRDETPARRRQLALHCDRVRERGVVPRQVPLAPRVLNVQPEHVDAQV